MALVGGAGAAFIGRVHATAAQLDGRAELVAGVLSSNPEKARLAAPSFGIADARAYGSVGEMIESELALPEDQRIDFVSIATPNFTHYEIARASLEAGFDVFCDKPMTTTVQDADELVSVVEKTGAVFVLTHNYTGYPMIRQAREMVANGDIGEIQAVRSNYIQGWMCGLKPDPNPPRGGWKTDPAKAGSGSLGDVGTHAYNLICYVTGLTATEVSASLRTYQPGGQLDDYGQATIAFGDSQLGTITFSQISHGRLNDLSLEVDGTKGALLWRQEQPNELTVRRTGQATQIYERHPPAAYMNGSGRNACRIAGGHPEGFFEAFANIYNAGFDDIIRRASGGVCDKKTCYPNVYDGAAGVRFVQACQTSSNERGCWKSLLQLM
ncbi:MAG: Gfo/Idh/MocA family oxidoreductase [Planctomycetaceae bacterium]|nr:Gfo/Idh/MocA family oxidoreductase [Planctomycetaceae bacterium]MCB9926272.1 Gfo/Idh/MocA family oxidoreductase [Planctomycetaceae bacterium]